MEGRSSHIQSQSGERMSSHCQKFQHYHVGISIESFSYAEHSFTKVAGDTVIEV